MGRMMPLECEHGKVIDWGDFGPDHEDGSVRTEHCGECPVCDHCIATIDALTAEREQIQRANETMQQTLILYRAVVDAAKPFYDFWRPEPEDDPERPNAEDYEALCNTLAALTEPEEK